MPRTILALIVGVAALTLTATAAPPFGKKVTVTGDLVCAKCTLGEDSGCRHALIVEEKGKDDVIYYVDDKGVRERYHGKVCDAGDKEKVKVTGNLVEEKGKKHLKYPKVEFIK